MNKLSFRNRLLILLIGLVVGTQIVTLFTALSRTEQTERHRADQQLEDGAKNAQLQLKSRERQLANAVAVLTADFGLKDAMALRDRPTLASTLANHGRRIEADLTLALDTDGNLIASAEDSGPVEPELIAAASVMPMILSRMPLSSRNGCITSSIGFSSASSSEGPWLARWVTVARYSSPPISVTVG